jgi:hypothetical protein
MTRTITTIVENRVYTKEVEISIEKISNSNFPNCPGGDLGDLVGQASSPS